MDRQKMKVKICLVGEGAVGKTCLIRRFIQDQFDDRYISTLGAKVSPDALRERVAQVRVAPSNHNTWTCPPRKTYRDGFDAAPAICQSSRSQLGSVSCLKLFLSLRFFYSCQKF